MTKDRKPPSSKRKGTGRYNFRTVGVPEELYRELAEFAAGIERSKQWVARKAIREYIDRHQTPPES